MADAVSLEARKEEEKSNDVQGNLPPQKTQFGHGELPEKIQSKVDEVKQPESSVESMTKTFSKLGLPEPKYNWVNITEKFTEAASELKLGELVHDNMFGLFEAMSAIEMMDPKMDAGMLCNKAKKVIPFEIAVKSNMIKIKDFTPEELIGIMDELLACLVTWLEGHSLVQTLFICLYLHDPFLIEDPCLKAFCIAVLKSCDLIRLAVNKAQVFEEVNIKENQTVCTVVGEKSVIDGSGSVCYIVEAKEDFQSMTYGFKMAGEVTETRAAGMIKEAEEEISRRIKGIKSQLREETGENFELQMHVKKLEAVLARLKFYKAFYCSLVALEKTECSGVPTTKQLLQTAVSLIPTLTSTVELGIKPQVKPDNSQGTIMGFEPLVNQRLLPPSFPRYTAIFGREEALEYLDSMLKRLGHVCTIVDYTSLHVIIDFVSEFSKKRPCVLSRTRLQLFVWPDHNNKVFGKIPAGEMIRDAIKVFNSPPSIAEKSSLGNNPKARELSDAFINRAIRPLNKLLHALGHNRARLRDKLGHSLEEFAALQDEADKVDAQLHTLLTKVEPQRQHFACFGSWVLYHSLNIMIQFLLSGFELELYSAHEYHYIFWYLDFLFGWHMTCLNRAEKLLQAQETALEHKSGKSGKKNKKKKKATEKVIQEHQGMRHLYQGMRHLCQGYLRALEGFELEGKTKIPKNEFGSEQIRFEHRFRPFQAVDTPQPMYYTHYKVFKDNARSNGATDADLFLMSSNCFYQAKSIFEMVANVHEEVNYLLKVTKTNLVVTKLAAGGHKHESRNPPQFDFSAHRAFPIIRLT